MRPSALGRALDIFYGVCGVLAGLCLVSIAALVLLQIVARILGLVLTWTPEFAGYAMAASAFLALSYTFKSGGHIRLGMVLNQLPQGGRRWLNVACLVLGLGIVGYFAWSTGVMAWQSYRFNALGMGSFAVPLWIPQSAMAFGVSALALALLDSLARVLIWGDPPHHDTETLS